MRAGQELRGTAIAEGEEPAADAAATRVRVGAGEELDLVGAVGPEMREADDRAVADRDERVEPGIGALPVQAGDDVGGGRARDALMHERAGVQEL